MRIFRPSLSCLLGIILCGVAIVGCESDDDEKPMTEEQAEAEIEDVSLFGTWKGIAGTGQVGITLKLEPVNTGFSGSPAATGSLTWPRNDVRNVFGWYQNGNPNKVDLMIQSNSSVTEGDAWDLTIQRQHHDWLRTEA